MGGHLLVEKREHSLTKQPGLPQQEQPTTCEAPRALATTSIHSGRDQTASGTAKNQGPKDTTFIKMAYKQKTSCMARLSQNAAAQEPSKVPPTPVSEYCS